MRINRRQFNLEMTAAVLGLGAIPQRLCAEPQPDGQQSGRPPHTVGRDAFILFL
jgi:hypothetical protein